MDLTPYLTQLREDLTTTAAAGDEATRRAAAVLSSAIEPAARLALMNALADLAAEVTSHLDEHVVEVRLDGGEVRVVVTGGGKPATDANESAEPPPPPVDGDISRMTLRLFEEIKQKAEDAAAEQGVSLNTFVSQAVQGALHGEGPYGRPRGPRRRRGYRPPGGNDLHGWVRG